MISNDILYIYDFDSQNPTQHKPFKVVIELGNLFDSILCHFIYCYLSLSLSMYIYIYIYYTYIYRYIRIVLQPAIAIRVCYAISFAHIPVLHHYTDNACILQFVHEHDKCFILSVRCLRERCPPDLSCRPGSGGRPGVGLPAAIRANTPGHARFYDVWNGDSPGLADSS